MFSICSFVNRVIIPWGR